jgi:hypothetical protein
MYVRCIKNESAKKIGAEELEIGKIYETKTYCKDFFSLNNQYIYRQSDFEVLPFQDGDEVFFINGDGERVRGVVKWVKSDMNTAFPIKTEPDGWWCDPYGNVTGCGYKLQFEFEDSSDGDFHKYKFSSKIDVDFLCDENLIDGARAFVVVGPNNCLLGVINNIDSVGLAKDNGFFFTDNNVSFDDDRFYVEDYTPDQEFYKLAVFPREDVAVARSVMKDIEDMERKRYNDYKVQQREMRGQMKRLPYSFYVHQYTPGDEAID